MIPKDKKFSDTYKATFSNEIVEEIKKVTNMVTIFLKWQSLKTLLQ